MTYKGYPVELDEEYSNESMEETGTGIIFDFNRLEHRTVTTTSLTDLYGFPVFSQTFTEQVNQFHRIRQAGIQESYLQVLTGEREEDLEEYFFAVMRADPEIIIQTNWETPPPPESPLVMIGFASIGMLAACFLWFVIEKVRKKRKNL